ncbi:MAG: hypothetical protein KAQ98_12415 [Bacteriovoracaceae bacterium]|nr:hypothetical protein [Bacteriovoracaceae bacterium]
MRKKGVRYSEFLAGGGFRLLALAGDVVIALTIYFYFQSHVFYKKVVWELLRNLKTIPVVNLLSDLRLEGIVSVLLVYGIYIVLRFYTTILFGVSLNQFILGMRGNRGLVWNRIGGAGRVVVEAVLGPFIIFDLSCWWGRQTLKELLSWTMIIQHPTIYRYISLILYVPFITSLAFLSPLFFNLTIIDGVEIELLGKYEKKLDNDSDFKSFRHFSTNHFKFQAFSSLKKDGRFILMPNFEIITVGDSKNGSLKKRIYPNLLVYDRQLSTYGILKITKRFSILDLIRLGAGGNPFFTLKYPALAEILEDKKQKFTIKIYEEKYHANTLFHQKIKNEIRDLIRSSFTLGFGNLVSHVLRNGPFMSGYVASRNNLLKMIPGGQAPLVSFVKMGNYEFIKLRQSFKFSGMFRKNEFETLIPLDTNNVMVFEFNYSDNKKSPKSWEIFQKSFFNSVEWYFDYDDVFQFPSDINDMEPLHIIDYFVKEKLEEKQRMMLEDFVYHHCFDAAKSAISGNDEELRKILLVLIDRYLEVIRLKNVKEGGYYSTRFENVLRDLRSSIDKKDMEFFNL